MADDPKTKQDQPSEGAAAPEEKVAQEAAEAKAEVAEQAAAEAAEAAEPEAPQAEAPQAEAPQAEAPEAAPEADAPETEAEAAPPAEEAPKPKRRTRRPAAKKDEPKEEPKPAPKKAIPAGERAVVRAQAKYVRTSARKARLVCDHIRGKSVDEARAILAHAPRAVASDWSKLLESAVANAEHNHELVGDDLRILAVHADEGPTLKRFRPRAMGRATKIRKRTSHLTITLTPKE
jgi:ribosomal protein L22